MSIEDFEAVTRSKVAGSWNLHILLPKDMDFFILLSSLAGVIGSRAQANYAAGNTFQDALARHRVSMGQKATAIDLGLVLDIGYAAERDSVTRSLTASGYVGINEKEIYEMMDYWCDPAREIATPENCQILTDLVTPASLRRRGLDEHFWMKAPMFRPLHLRDIQASATTDDQTEAKPNLAVALRSVVAQDDAVRLITDALVTKLSKSLAVPTSEIDTRKPIYSYGVDSLVAVDIRYWFLKEVDVELRVMDIMGNSSMADFCLMVAIRSPYCNFAVNEAAAEPETPR